ncbi:hypothetical protein I4F81_005912 [Pyropia yezoensis]|uniref:Uncharacterized protein n=1 Tax=Pyropia yezoensis TaxID=2788 RepID=A0ACC3BZS0_PYRYE|nr:hypothetical protein I4F81_005912 [Neopyropia yezoensis]
MRLGAGLLGARPSRRAIPTLPPRPVRCGTTGAGGGSGGPPGGGGAPPAVHHGVSSVGRLLGWYKGGDGGGGWSGGSGRLAARSSFRVATLVVLTAAAVGSVAWLEVGGGGGGTAAFSHPSWHLAAFLYARVQLSDAANAVLDGGAEGAGGGVDAAVDVAAASSAESVAVGPPRVTGGGDGGDGDGGGALGHDGASRAGTGTGGGGVADAVSPPPPLPPSPPPPPAAPRPAEPVRLTVYIHDRVGWERAYVDSLFDSPAVAVTRVPLTTAQMQGTARGPSSTMGRRPPRGAATALVINAMLLKGSTPSQEAAFERLVRWLSPAVSVFCSDERGQVGWAHAAMMAHSATTLRQYAVYTYNNASTEGWGDRGGRGGHHRTSHAIPLGYMAGMFDSNYTARRRAAANATTLASQRRYAWAFPSKLLGKDREPMLAAFRSWAGVPYTVGPRSVQATRVAYESAAFVPNSHGNVVLDCFRLYEASMAGAIPVLVASSSEFRTNFGALPELPPWVVAPDWPAALAAVRALAADGGALSLSRSSHSTGEDKAGLVWFPPPS